jgi:hypothetical protein
MVCFVPLGIDCTLARLLRECGLRREAYPFDWNMTYRGVAEYVASQFNTFNPDNKDLLFLHDTFPADATKYERRIARLMHLLESDEEVWFLRKSHSLHHHKEHACLKDDVDDMRELEALLNARYPALKFHMLLFQTCSQCHVNNNTHAAQAGDRLEVVSFADRATNETALVKSFLLARFT